MGATLTLAVSANGTDYTIEELLVMTNEFKGKGIETIWNAEVSSVGDKVMGLVYNAVSGKVYGCLAGSTSQQDVAVVTEYDDYAKSGPSDFRIWKGTVKSVAFTKAWVVAKPTVKPNLLKLKGVKTFADCHKKVTEVIKLPENLMTVGGQLGAMHLANQLGIDYALSKDASAKARSLQQAMGPIEWKKLCGAINRATNEILGITFDDKKKPAKKAEAKKEEVVSFL